MNERPPNTKELLLKYGIGNSTCIYVNRELTIGKLLSYREVQTELGYNYHNVVAMIGSDVVDFETYVGAEDTIISLQTAANEKAALAIRKVIDDLAELVGLQFKRHGGSHDVYITDDGVQIYIPRHARDMATGTLRSILNDAMPGTSISEFKKKLSE